MVARPDIGQALKSRLSEYKDARPGQALPSCPADLLVLSPDRMSDRRTANTVYEAYDEDAFVAPVTELDAGGERIWRQTGYYYDEEWSVNAILQATRGSDAQTSYAPVPDAYRRAALPRPAPPPGPVLTRADKLLMRALADWPLASIQTLPPLACLSESQTWSSMATLRRCGLAHTAELDPDPLYALTDAGHKLIVEAAHGSLGNILKSWSSERDETGSYVGRLLSKRHRTERDHTTMIYDITSRFAVAAQMATAVIDYAIIPDHQDLNAFPVEDEEDTRSIAPDATILLRRENGTQVLLLEVEPGAPSPKKMRERLASYDEYFETDWSDYDYGNWPYICVVLKDAAMESRFLLTQREADLTHLPIVTTEPGRMEADPVGPFGAIWRTPKNLAAMIPYWNWCHVKEEEEENDTGN